jgi:hypothetical protein
MTTYTFMAKRGATTTFVDWNDPTVWVGGVFPNSLSADVVIPSLSSGWAITIESGQSYSVNSVSLTGNVLIIDGTLSVTNGFSIMSGGEIDMAGNLSVGSLVNDGVDIQGNGQVSVVGTITNQTSIIGDGLTVTAGGLDNTGTLQASSGDLTVTVTSGGFTNLSGSTLTGGTYGAGFDGNTSPNILYLNIGGTIAVDAANIEILGGGDIDCYDASSSAYVPIEQTLQTIASSGMLTLGGQTFDFGSLTDNGTIVLYNSSVELDASQLTVSSSGTAEGAGTIEAPIANDGVVAAEYEIPANAFGGPAFALKIIGAVTGDGLLEIGQRTFDFEQHYYDVPLELDGPISGNSVAFTDQYGTLLLDDPVDFAGTFSSIFIGDTIDLTNVQAVSVRVGASAIYVTESNTQVLTFALAHPFDLGFSLQSDGFGGTNLTAISANSNDINGDSCADVVVQNPSTGNMLYADMAGGSFTGWAAVNTAPGYSVVGTGDVNGDGFADVVVQSTTGVIDYANMAGGVFSGWRAVGNTPGYDVVGVGDVKGNGYADVVVQNAGGQIDYADMTGGVLSGWVGVANTPGFNVGGVGDIKGDGYADVVVQNAGGQIDYADMTGGVFSGWVGVANTPGYNVVGVGDIMGNGYADIVVQSASGQIDYANMTGGVLSGWVVVANTPGWTVSAVEDVNGDGFADVVIQNSSGQIDYANMDNGVLSGFAVVANAPGYTVASISGVTMSDLVTSGNNALAPVSMFDPGLAASATSTSSTQLNTPVANVLHVAAT